MFEDEIKNLKGDNLYKFVVIIGLVLFLLNPIINRSFLDNKLKIIDLNMDLNNELKRSERQAKETEDAAIEIQNQLDKFEDEVRNEIISWNLYSETNEQIDNYDDLNIAMDYYSKVIIEFKNHTLEKKVINADYINTLTNIYKKLLQFIGENDVTQFEANTNRFQELIEKVELADKRLDEWAAIFEENKLKFEMYNSEWEKIREIHNSLKSDVDKLAIQDKYYTNENIINNMIRIFGILLILGGIVLWYIKIQKYSDLEIKKRVSNIQTENK